MATVDAKTPSSSSSTEVVTESSLIPVDAAVIPAIILSYAMIYVIIPINTNSCRSTTSPFPLLVLQIGEW